MTSDRFPRILPVSIIFSIFLSFSGCLCRNDSRQGRKTGTHFNWPSTPVNQTATQQCSTNDIHNATRRCFLDNSRQLASWSDDINESSCRISDERRASILANLAAVSILINFQYGMIMLQT